MPQREITLRFLAEPTAVNFGGKVHGGAVMKWIDEAGYACAAGWSGRYCVTIYVGGIRFHQPIHIGDMVEVCARIIYTGRTSMHVAVQVSAGDPKTDNRRDTTQCIIVFVAVDDNGHSVAVPAWEPRDNADIALQSYAKNMMALGKEMEQNAIPFGGIASGAKS